MREKVITYTVFILALIAIASYGLYKWLIEGQERLDSLIYFSLVSAYFLNYLTSSKTVISDRVEKERHLSSEASTISYLVLVVVIGIILFITEGTGMLADLENVPLVLCFSLSLVILPIVRTIVFMKNN
ncbi:hypothetical protein [Salimicrobium flavidum]|uniref:Uncharacterized protein n=1 Tax=Salimicrobium flavidum TaxID=570947 RepID=A0A1N7J786_9BACI|nr:hypothetical protein [Salimicrobium flavidum]SIS45111.1 hypothetical protein SAMN05421687_10449 [Salimicrobium flavidum]